MDYFEQIAARYLEAQGYWIRRGERIDLSKKDKRDLGKPSLPRPEVDLVGYKARDDVLVLFEVKSYLDSPGVKYDALAASTNGEGRLKLLTDRKYQTMLAERLKSDYVMKRLVHEATKVVFGLVAGNVPRGDRQRVKALAAERGWVYVSPEEIAAWVRSRAAEPYENDPVTLAAKLVLRDWAGPNQP